MKILIGWPIRRFDCVEQVRDTLHWAWGLEGKHEIRYFMDCTYGVDMARSRIIYEARKWGADLLIMVDSDAVPKTLARECLSFAAQAFSRGFCALVAPTVSSDDKIMLWAPADRPPFQTLADIPRGQAFPIDWGALGLVFIRGEALAVLKPLAEQPFLNGPTPDWTLPLYCLYTPKEGEDRSLCHNLAASTGRKVGADTRLVVEHFKLKGKTPPWVGNAV